MALGWVTSRPAVTAPIIRAKILEQLEENLVARDFVLSEGDTAHLDEVSAPTPNDYPYGPFAVKQLDRYVHSSDQAITELF